MIERIKACLRIRPCLCRDCDQVVAGFTNICANCGAANPVQVPRWIGILILGFTIQNFVLMFT